MAIVRRGAINTYISKQSLDELTKITNSFNNFINITLLIRLLNIKLVRNI